MAKGYYKDHYALKKARLEKLQKTKGLCETCGERGNVVHHIDGDHDNHEADNLVVLCNKCHGACHREDKHSKKYGTRTKTSKYIRAYGKTLEEIAEITGCNANYIQGLHATDMLADYLKKLGLSVPLLTNKKK